MQMRMYAHSYTSNLSVTQLAPLRAHVNMQVVFTHPESPSPSPQGSFSIPPCIFLSPWMKEWPLKSHGATTGIKADLGGKVSRCGH